MFLYRTLSRGGGEGQGEEGDMMTRIHFRRAKEIGAQVPIAPQLRLKRLWARHR